MTRAPFPLLPAHAYARLKAATAEALRATPEGNAEAFAARTRVCARSLRLYADHTADLFAPLDVVADLEAATAAPIFARVLADLSGYTLAPKEANEEAAAFDVLRTAGETVAQVARLAQAGKLDHREAARARKVLGETLKACAALDAALAQRLGEG